MMAQSKYYGAKADNRPSDTDKMKYGPFVNDAPFPIIINWLTFVVERRYVDCHQM